ncbi:hypothetical protein MKEN_00087300 [Mycena kentingensis (nom. inval.)]|nr:hypothetical protein MKEN_00087300 [Mycena kentingensis (nom. inval.)]
MSMETPILKSSVRLAASGNGSGNKLCRIRPVAAIAVRRVAMQKTAASFQHRRVHEDCRAFDSFCLRLLPSPASRRRRSTSPRSEENDALNNRAIGQQRRGQRERLERAERGEAAARGRGQLLLAINPMHVRLASAFVESERLSRRSGRGEENELTGGSGGASERGLSVDSESSRSARSEDAESRSSCRIVRLQAVRFSHDVDASNMIHGPDDAFLLPVARTSKSQTAATTSEDGDLRGFSGFDESPIPRRRRLRPQPVFDVAQKGPVTVRWVGPGPKRPSHIFLYPQLPSSCACRHEQNCPRARTNMLGGKKLTCHHLQIDRTCGDEQKAPGLSTQSCPQAHIFAPVGWFILCPRARTAYPRGLLVNLPPSPFV